MTTTAFNMNLINMAAGIQADKSSIWQKIVDSVIVKSGEEVGKVGFNKLCTTSCKAVMTAGSGLLAKTGLAATISSLGGPLLMAMTVAATVMAPLAVEAIYDGIKGIETNRNKAIVQKADAEMGAQLIATGVKPVKPVEQAAVGVHMNDLAIRIKQNQTELNSVKSFVDMGVNTPQTDAKLAILEQNIKTQQARLADAYVTTRQWGMITKEMKQTFMPVMASDTAAVLERQEQPKPMTYATRPMAVKFNTPVLSA